MKILIVSQYYYPERNSVSDVASFLVKNNHDVTVLTAKPNYGFQRILEEYKNIDFEVVNGVKVHRLTISPRKYSRLSVICNYLSFYFKSLKYINKFKEKFDVVLSFSLSPVISISAANKIKEKQNIPHILYCMDLWPESTVATNAVSKDSLLYDILKKWSKSIYNKCDKIIISSPSFKQYFHDVLDLKDKQYIYINQPIIKSKSDTINPIIYEKKHNFVYAGNIAKLQLIDEIVDSFYDLNNAQLHLMGMGRELERIKDKIKNNDDVVYEGALPIEQAERFFVNADALIVSLDDKEYVGRTIPNKAIQYLSYGKPIICVAKGDCQELLKECGGVIFADKDLSSIRSAYQKIISLSDEEKEIMGKANKKYYDEHLTNDVLIKKIEEVLSSSIKN